MSFDVRQFRLFSRLRLFTVCVAIGLGLILGLHQWSALAAQDLPQTAAQPELRLRSNATSVGITGPAVSLLNARALLCSSAFFLYLDSDSGCNHAFFSGWFPGGAVLAKIHLDTACVYDATAANRCSTSPAALDRTRHTAVRVSFDPLASGEFAGINVEEPENYGVLGTGQGYDLRGATRLCMDVLSPSGPGFSVQFNVAQHATPFLTFSDAWTPVCLDFSTLGLTSTDLANVHFPFTIVTNDRYASAGGTVLMDNIRFEPLPTSQNSINSFPIANEVFGVVPVPDVQPGRVPIPPDQVQANLTTIYESSLAVLALLRTSGTQDLVTARSILDAFVYALGHDNQGLPIPKAADGSVGLHNGYINGDLPLFNSQPGGAQQGQVRLSGFSIASSLCGSSHFCLVLDGATGGNNAFAILALAAGFQKFGDSRYLNAAKEIGNWIYENLADQTGTGYGGYYVGYPDQGQPKVLILGKSIENNADIFRALGVLSSLAQTTAESKEWDRRARIAGDFVIQMFEPVSGRFYAGTVPSGTPSSPGILPSGPSRGNDVVNASDFIDSQSFTTLAMADSQQYYAALDWRRPIQWAKDHFGQTVSAGGRSYQGFNIVATPTSGPTGVAWEFTGQEVLAMQLVDQIYSDTRFAADVQTYLAQIRQAQQFSPFGDGQGLVAATIDSGDTLPPYQQCVSTPFQCISSRTGMAATAWGIFAEQAVNPFDAGVPDIPAGAVACSSPFAGTLTCQWTPGTAYLFGVWVGAGGVGSADLATPPLTTANSATVTGIPTDGRTIYVRVWSRFRDGSWAFGDSTYTTVNLTPGTITSPTNGSTLPSSSVTFQWSAGGASAYGLWIGSTGVGSADLGTPPVTTSASYTATGLPADGRTIYVRLWSQFSNGSWKYNDYTYKAANFTPGAITNPINGSTLPSATPTFQWSAGGGAQFGLWIGSSGVGSADLAAPPVTISTSYAATSLPTDGRTIYVRLWSQFSNGSWKYNDYTYKASMQ